MDKSTMQVSVIMSFH